MGRHVYQLHFGDTYFYWAHPMKTSVFLSAVLCGAAVAASSLAGAAALSFLNGTILKQIPAKDLPSFEKTVKNALDSVPVNAHMEWQSMSGPANRPIQVLLTPLEDKQAQNGQPCRNLEGQVSQREASERWQFWFCKQPNGSWKITGNNPL